MTFIQWSVVVMTSPQMDSNMVSRDVSLMHMQMIDCLVTFNFNSQESFMVWQSPLQGMMLVELTSLQ